MNLVFDQTDEFSQNNDSGTHPTFFGYKTNI